MWRVAYSDDEPGAALAGKLDRSSDLRRVGSASGERSRVRVLVGLSGGVDSAVAVDAREVADAPCRFPLGGSTKREVRVFIPDGVAPGQAAVFYDGDLVVGTATIEGAS